MPEGNQLMKKEAKAQDAPQKYKSIKLKTLVIVGALLLLLAVVILAVFTYQQTLTGEKAVGFARLKASFLPAVIVDGTSLITIGDVEKNLGAMRKFYETQDYSTVGLRVDFTTEDGKKRLLIKERELLNKMIEDRFVQILAKENGVDISKADVTAAVGSKLEEYGNKDSVVEDLATHYGWTIEDFKQEIVLPDMYKEALAKRVAASSEAANTKAKERIESAQKKLLAGTDFVQVAKELSDGSTAKEGGELGWVTKDQLTPELSTAVFGADNPQKFAIIESSLGFHIVDVEEKKKDQGNDVVRMRQVFVRKETFTNWLDAKIKERGVRVLLKDFTWDKGAGSVEFSAGNMRQFEEEILKKSQGDASLLF